MQILKTITSALEMGELYVHELWFNKAVTSSTWPMESPVTAIFSH